MKDHHHWKWLAGKLPDWVSQGIISSEQAHQIGALAPAGTESPSSLAGRILISISALLIGLGVISFFAYNWQSMPKFLKLALIFGAFLGAHLTGTWLGVKGKTDQRTKQAEFCHLLGTLFFGAAIMLIAQIYHIDEHFPNGILLWSLGAGLMAWVLFSTPQMLLYGALTVLWQAYERGFDLPQLWGLFLAAAVMIPFAVLKKQWFAAAIVTLTLAAILPIQLSFFRFGVMVSIMFTGALGVGVGMLVRRSGQEACARPPEMAGAALYFIALVAFTYESGVRSGLLRSYHNTGDQTALLVPILMAMITVILWACFLFPFDTLKQRYSRVVRKDQFLILLGFGVALVLWWSSRFVDTGTRRDLAALGMITFNLLALAQGLWMILSGTRLGNMGTSFVGCLLVVIVILSRFAAYADNLLLRSIGFIAAGVFVLIIALKTSRVRQKRGDHVKEK